MFLKKNKYHQVRLFINKKIYMCIYMCLCLMKLKLKKYKKKEKCLFNFVIFEGLLIADQLERLREGIDVHD